MTIISKQKYKDFDIKNEINIKVKLQVDIYLFIQRNHFQIKKYRGIFSVVHIFRGELLRQRISVSYDYVSMNAAKFENFTAI